MPLKPHNKSIMANIQPHPFQSWENEVREKENLDRGHGSIKDI